MPPHCTEQRGRPLRLSSRSQPVFVASPCLHSNRAESMADAWDPFADPADAPAPAPRPRQRAEGSKHAAVSEDRGCACSMYDYACMKGCAGTLYCVLFCCVVFCCVVLCCVVLCCVVLCCVVLCCAVLCCVVLCCVVLCYVALCYVALCYVTLCSVLFCSVLFY